MELIPLIAAIIVAWLVFTGLVKILKASINTAVSIALIMLVVQLVWGIGPQEVWQQLLELPETVKSIFQSLLKK